ncbi:nuclear fragile X mental retardation-interacting protein 1 isoform X1 [Oryzias latipes]|uniref:Nuclear FMR1 interacting protein 1 n=1 Tax=Oryzias latipes TaxID=8090 RepID=A0A3B3IE68_ORYLA|nr:nuclear fragile X mental retardation-interacting protein 1 isoform X1 [Oryzias latipes]
MSEEGRYPPPDFSCPPASSSQHLQQPPRFSGFQPGMWNWTESPCEPSRGSPAWQHQEPARGFGFQPGWGNHGHTHPYSPNVGYEWYQGGRNNSGPHYQPWKKQKNKKEPEYSHFCDTCDRGFKNQQKYNEHISQHVKCSVPDCSFMAHEKLVAIHWRHNHAPGARRIKLDTEEEISKWREERRKNYPTLENVVKKRKIVELRQETGGVLETAQFGRMRGRGRGWRGRGFRGRHQPGPHPHPANQKSPENPKPLNQVSQEGDPLGVLASGDHDSDREDKDMKAKALFVAPKQMSSALGSLMSSYGSMSESESGDEPEVSPIQRAKELVQENQTILNGANSGGSGSSRCVEPMTETTHAECGLNMQSRRSDRGARRGRGRGRGRGHCEPPQIRQPTLLEMLLAPDIRHERNVLLQCVRFVVRNNFFGLDQTAVKAPLAARHHQRVEETPSKVSSESAVPAGEDGLSTEGAEADPLAVNNLKEDKDVDHMDSAICDVSAEEPASKVKKAEEKITPTYNDYAVEIWEFNGSSV